MDIDDGLKDSGDSSGIEEGSRIEEGEAVALPNWDDPQVREMFTKIDEFLANPGSGVPRERPARRTDKGHGCADPECQDGIIQVDLNTPEGMERAIEAVENAVMDAQFKSRGIKDEQASLPVLESLIVYLMTVPQGVIVGALMGISDAAAGVFIEYEKLSGGTDAERQGGDQ